MRDLPMVSYVRIFQRRVHKIHESHYSYSHLQKPIEREESKDIKEEEITFMKKVSTSIVFPICDVLLYKKKSKL
jgi:hypothetical protein